jgi:hypothetical protein
MENCFETYGCLWSCIDEFADLESSAPDGAYLPYGAAVVLRG